MTEPPIQVLNILNNDTVAAFLQAGHDLREYTLIKEIMVSAQLYILCILSN
jgi:hypothetical protein